MQLSRIPVEFEVVFPKGAYVLAVSPVRDFDASTPGRGVQARDKDNGELLWQVDVIDGNTDSPGDKQVRVKIAAPHQPVPPEALPGAPFRPVEFDGLTVTPWVDSQRCTGAKKGEPVAKAYRLLRSIMGTAVEDELIRRNPCRIKGAGVERPAERPVLTVAQVFALAEAIAPRYRALVLLATFASLRWGELAALRRHCVDLDARVIRVEASVVELKDGSLVTGRPKTDAGERKVVIPSVIVDDLRWHMQRFADRDPQGLVFVGELGAQLRRSNFSRAWNKAREAIGLPDLHFHDLRHTGNTLAAMTGAHMRELMERMGHSSTKAAMGYLHSTSERAKVLADALGDLVERERSAPVDPPGNGDDPPLLGARG